MNEVKSIGVVGGGMVGRATARCFMEWGLVKVYDSDPDRSTHKAEDVLACDLVFLCLPTPQEPMGYRADTSAIESFLSPLAGSEANLVLKSTVPVGTTRRLREEYRLPNLVHSPEFLTARCSLVDAQTPARNIVGGEYGDCSKTLTNLLSKRFPGVPVIQMTSDESELVKLVVNGFFSVKVAYFNEVRTLADQLGMSWDRVMRGVLSDGRIAHSHTQVPGPDGQRGFGGACLPKDLGNLITMILDAKQTPWVTNAAMMRNRTTDRPGTLGEGQQ